MLLSNLWRTGAIALAIALALVMWRADTISGKLDDTREALRNAEATIAVLEVDADLKDSAAIERQADNSAVSQMEKDLIDAVAKTPDSAPSAKRVALGCERLRRSEKYAEADLPAVCRSDSGTEAGPAS